VVTSRTNRKTIDGSTKETGVEKKSPHSYAVVFRKERFWKKGRKNEIPRSDCLYFDFEIL